MDFTGSRVLITGAAGGLGSALTSRFLSAGARVLATDLPGADWSAAPDAERLELDVTSVEQWSRARHHVETRWHGLDILVNNAGVAGGGRLDHSDLEEWRRITEINLFGVVNGLQSFTPMLKAQGSGTIVNIASLAGLVHPAGMASYNAVKAAVVALTETAGHELAAFGVRTMVVCPSYFRTGLLDSLQVRDQALTATMRKLIAGSPTSADDVAAAVLAGLADGTELLLPDAAGRAAYTLKTDDRPAYDALMRKQAQQLHDAEAR